MSSDLTNLRKLKRILDLIQKEIDPDMPIGYLRAMTELMIAHIDTGANRIDLTQKDLIERTGMPQANLSRAVNALDSSYKLADNMPHPLDRRFRHVRLNDKGKALMRNISRIVGE